MGRSVSKSTGCRGMSVVLRPWAGWVVTALLACGGVPGANAQAPAVDAFDPGANNAIHAIALQPADGKILLAGYFNQIGGQPRTGFARLRADGTLDAAFNPDFGSSIDTSALLVQTDGKILVGGAFTTVNGVLRNRIARLNADGSLDTGFSLGADSSIITFMPQPDGKVLVGGVFTQFGGQPRHRLARLNADGTLDAGFNPDANDWVGTLAVQPDGKILVGGGFTTIGGKARNRLARLNADGTVDAGFNPNLDSTVWSLAVQPDSKILVSGFFSVVCGQTRNRIARLNADGTLDAGFNPNASDGVHTLAVQADGQIILAGRFLTLGGQARRRLGRVNADGSLDLSFDPGIVADSGQPYYEVAEALAVQADGKILVGGGFGTLSGQSRRYVGRLNNTGSPTRSLNYAGTTVTWLRGGTAPEAAWTVFEYTADGAAWSALGKGTRVAGGWQLNNVAVTGGVIRARGFLVSGCGSRGGWFETADIGIGAPVFKTQPTSCTNKVGTSATFAVETIGASSVSYQWQKDGVNLANGGNIAGANSATLSVSGVQHADAGGYAVVFANASGSVTSSVAVLTVVDPAINVQPVSQCGRAGGSVTLSVTAAGTGPFAYQWLKEGETLPGATGASLNVADLRSADAGHYAAVVSGTYGCITSAVAELAVNLAQPDAGFAPAQNGVYGQVFSLATQPDGKVLVCGSFWVQGSQPRNCFARLNADGSLDAAFNTGTCDYPVYAAAVQPDGKILVAGQFTTLCGQSRQRLARLNSDGTLDASFNPGANNVVSSLAVQSDGKILAGGWFATMAGQSRIGIARLNADGTLDAGFNPGQLTSYVYSMQVQPDGKILAGGWFTSLGGQPHVNLARLNPDGTADASFNARADGCVFSVQAQPDGKILVGGSFKWMDEQPRDNLGRLNADGTLDAGFNPGANARVYALALQTDGKILAGGRFTRLGGEQRSGMARLNADGTLDSTFAPSVGGEVSSLALQPDGGLLLGGTFYSIDGQSSYQAVARLRNTGPATDALNYDGTTVTWLRGGTAPEVWRTTFEHSANGTVWTALGAGTRCAGGWKLDGVHVALGTLRARGYCSIGGVDGMSGGLVESSFGAPVFTALATNCVNTAGDDTAFTVRVAGSGPFSYQWRRNGKNLSDGDGIAGATAATLCLSGVRYGDGGTYDVIVSNAFGSLTGAAATLSVADPAILAQPVSQIGQAGGEVTFSVSAAGTGLTYQWRKNGEELADATDASLTLTKLRGSSAGDYDVIVSGDYGSVTSAVATLGVNLVGTDTGFTADAGDGVFALAVQADGKLLVGGCFETFGGESLSRLARLNVDGTVDTDFAPQINGEVNCLAVQADGKIVMGGWFSEVNGETRNYLARLNEDGTLDMDFDPNVDDGVAALLVQDDGKLVAGGWFTEAAGETHNRLVRLNEDGTLDTDFLPNVQGGEVLALAAQPDGKLVVGGWFNAVGDTDCNCLVRLNPDGTLDGDFNPYASDGVAALLVQPDGKIVAGGWFTEVAGETRNRLVRLNADGTLDGDFRPDVAGDAVHTLALQEDGAIVVGGWFTEVNGTPRSHIARLNADGTLDDGFNPSTDGEVDALRVQPSGRILVGGWFSTLGGQKHACFGRLNGTDSDGDGVPDWWMIQYFGRPTLDDDGAAERAIGHPSTLSHKNLLFKYTAGLDPTDPSSVFSLGIAPVSGEPGQKRLTFGPRWNDRLYRLQYRTSLTEGDWTDVPNTDTEDNDVERNVIDLDAADSSRFYRVRIAVP